MRKAEFDPSTKKEQEKKNQVENFRRLKIIFLFSKKKKKKIRLGTSSYSEGREISRFTIQGQPTQ
jgi:hypothetical protein